MRRLHRPEKHRREESLLSFVGDIYQKAEVVRGLCYLLGLSTSKVGNGNNNLGTALRKCGSTTFPAHFDVEK